MFVRFRKLELPKLLLLLVCAPLVASALVPPARPGPEAVDAGASGGPVEVLIHSSEIRGSGNEGRALPKVLLLAVRLPLRASALLAASESGCSDAD